MKNKILNKIYSASPVQEKKIKSFFSENPNMENDLEDFLEVYKPFMDIEKITPGDVADAYIEMLGQMMFCRKEFNATGEYLVKNQKQAFAETYNNELLMTRYMIALALSQFLWKHHYEVFNFFKDEITQVQDNCNVLEVGSGHGLLLLEALKNIRQSQSFDVVDISPASIRMSKNVLHSIDEKYLKKVNFYTSDINDFKTHKKYDFIIIGEVVEHVDDPLRILISLYNMLADKGTLFLTTCANCPTIDHVYHFKNVREIQSLIKEAGYVISKEKIVPSVDNKSEEYIEKYKLDVIYAATIAKNG